MVARRTTSLNRSPNLSLSAAAGLHQDRALAVPSPTETRNDLRVRDTRGHRQQKFSCSDRLAALSRDSAKEATETAAIHKELADVAR